MAAQRYTTKEVVEALRKARGIKAKAAELLGCDRHTVDNYVKRYPTVARAYNNLREAMVDRAERNLQKLLDDEDWPATKFTLMTLGKDRGYSEQVGVDVTSGGKPLDKAFEQALARAYGTNDVGVHTHGDDGDPLGDGEETQGD